MQDNHRAGGADGRVATLRRASEALRSLPAPTPRGDTPVDPAYYAGVVHIRRLIAQLARDGVVVDP